MTKAEFMVFLKKGAAYYPNFVPTNEAKDAWYEALNGLSLGNVLKTLDDYARKSHFPPTVSDILHGGRKPTNNKIRANDFANGEISDIDMWLIEEQKRKWGTGAELRKRLEEDGFRVGGLL